MIKHRIAVDGRCNVITCTLQVNGLLVQNMSSAVTKLRDSWKQRSLYCTPSECVISQLPSDCVMSQLPSDCIMSQLPSDRVMSQLPSDCVISQPSLIVQVYDWNHVLCPNHSLTVLCHNHSLTVSCHSHPVIMTHSGNVQCADEDIDHADFT